MIGPKKINYFIYCRIFFYLDINNQIKTKNNLVFISYSQILLFKYCLKNSSKITRKGLLFDTVQ